MPKRGAGLAPARILFAEDGTAQAPDYGDVYHSASGGLGQARHVFLAGNGLPARWAGRQRFAILELGFGLGTNFLATWQAWRDDPQRAAQLHYVAVEKHPAALADLIAAHRHQPEVAALAAELQAAWPPALAGFHRLHLDQGRVHLTLLLGDAQALLGQVMGRFDAVYLDGFAPDCNPELWSPALMADLAWLAAPGATCTSYTVAQAVREALTAAGFAVEKRQGYGGKRDMLCGRIVQPQAIAVAAARAHDTIAVVGAGVAGVCVAERLAARGRRVVLIEAQDAPARGASGNLAAVMLPVLALDETRLARLNRAAFLYALHRLRALDAAGHAVRWSPCGVLHIPKSPELAERHARVVREGGLPTSFVQMLDRDAASALAGTPVADGGWWFPEAGWVAPASLCDALLAAAGERIEFRRDTALAALERSGDGWTLCDTRGETIVHADHVVLAHAHGLNTLAQTAHLPLRSFRGQVTHMPAQDDEAPRCVVCRDGYVTPPIDGWRSIGASFERGAATDLRAADHDANLARLAGVLPGLTFSRDGLSGRAGVRPVSPDKLPMLGALPLPSCESRPAAHVEWPRWPGLHVASGYGARGLTWAPLMAELLASQLCGEPLPIEADLVAAVDPARFAWKGQA